ncbi:phosphoribosylanthranilate isomerase [Marinobacter sp.]|uniref:phosphoribosylanthranilate isomerase n=1 Tax=Marinobacter sp. TaxID=50741 RepID=UPI00384BA03A
MRTRTKVCGITTRDHAVAAATAGADAIGLVFYGPSPRAVTLEVAADIARALPAFVNLVGLFVNPSPAEVKAVTEVVPLDLLQFHGDETPAFCEGFARRWIKAVRVQNREDIEAAFHTYHNASGILVDAWDPALYGGTGKGFDWSLIPSRRPVPLILAGGLNSDNVARAVAQVRPWAVDVSGGVELKGPNARKGIKDVSRINEFLKEVHRVDETD